jgi:hypothetical protein
MFRAPLGDSVLGVADDGLDAVASTGVPGWGQHHQQFRFVRDNALMPTDPR